jgi:hypothetical protein
MNDSLLSLGLMIWVEKQGWNGQGLMKNEYECSWHGFKYCSGKDIPCDSW